MVKILNVIRLKNSQLCHTVHDIDAYKKDKEKESLWNSSSDHLIQTSQ